mgnify:CR=1 FL=1
MKKIIIFLFVISVASCNQQKSSDYFITQFEKSEGTETPEYVDVINYYKELSKSYSEISFFEMGKTDAGLPLHLIVYNTDGKTQLNSIKNSTKNRVLINNGIHPGESDVIDIDTPFVVADKMLDEGRHHSLLVRQGDRIVGILRASDVFHYHHESIMKNKI